MCYPVCGMMHIKEPLLLIRKSSPCGSSEFPLSISEGSFTICLMPYNRKLNVLSASLNKIFPSFLAVHCPGSDDQAMDKHWREKRSTRRNTKHLEVFIAIDESVTRVVGKPNINIYLLTLMNVVSRRFNTF